MLVVGVIEVPIGVWAMRRPGQTIALLITLMGAWAVVTGIYQLLTAFELRKLPAQLGDQSDPMGDGTGKRRLHVTPASRPSRSVGTRVRNLYTSTAATTSAFAPPKPTRAVVRPSSMTPRPPGVIGIEPRRRMSDQAAKASIQLTSPAVTSNTRSETEQHAEHGEMSGQSRQREDVPAVAEKSDRIAAKLGERLP